MCDFRIYYKCIFGGRLTLLILALTDIFNMNLLNIFKLTIGMVIQKKAEWQGKAYLVLKFVPEYFP